MSNRIEINMDMSRISPGQSDRTRTTYVPQRFWWGSTFFWGVIHFQEVPEICSRRGSRSRVSKNMFFSIRSGYRDGLSLAGTSWVEQDSGGVCEPPPFAIYFKLEGGVYFQSMNTWWIK